MIKSQISEYLNVSRELATCCRPARPSIIFRTGTFLAGIAGPVLDRAYPHRLRQEIAVSLTGGGAGANNIIREGIDHLIEKCEYLIEIRGFDEWRG